MSPMSYSEILAACQNDPIFFVALLTWCALMAGFFFEAGRVFFRFIVRKLRRKP